MSQSNSHLPLSPLESLITSASRYAGIGSRAVSPVLEHWAERFAGMLAQRCITLRSGGAVGADTAFERGCVHAEGRCEIYLPWPQFADHPSLLNTPSTAAEELAASLHPGWHSCTSADRKLHARNCQQVLGENLDTLVDFVLFYAPEANGHIRGGTATAITLARSRNIPTFNLFHADTMAEWQAVTRQFERSRVSFWLDLFGGGPS